MASAEGFRFPVQLALRPQGAARDPRHVEYRGYAGQVARASFASATTVVVLPEGVRTRVAGIDTADGELAEARAGQSVALRLADDVDVTRGELLVSSAHDAPTPVQDVDAMVCWLAERPLRVGAKVLLKHGTRTVQGLVRQIHGRLDLDAMAPVATDTVELNDIGRVRLRLAAPIMAEDYTVSRRGGAFLLIDPQTAGTLAAGMVRGHEAFGDSFDDSLNWSI